MVSNSRFQDVVKKFSNLLYFKNEAFELKKNSVLLYFRIIFPPLSLCTTSYGYEQNKREIWKTSIPSVLLSSFWHVKIPNERRNRDATTFFRFQFIQLDYAWHFCISTWRFFFPCASNIIAIVYFLRTAENC